MEAIAIKNWKRSGSILLVTFVVVGVMLGSSALAAQRVPAIAEQKTGVTVYKNNRAEIDASNLSEGYLLVKYTGGKNVRIRAQVIKENGVSYTYDLNNTGKAEAFPLTEGNGKYTVRVLENTSGTKYAIAHSVPVELTLRASFLPYLYSNQYVNYTKDSAVVKKAAELVKDKTTDLTKLTAVYTFVVDNFTYDYEKAKTVQTGYLPVVDTVLVNRKGICFDYAAVMTAMLRSQGLPCKLVVGYADTTYHAWVNVYVDGEWKEGAIYFNGVKWNLMDPTFISSSGKSSQAAQFVGNINNYTQKYAY